MITTLNPSPTLNFEQVHRQRADYFRAVARGHPSEMLVAALDRYEAVPSSSARFAISLGCQDGCDTLELLQRQWQVLSIGGVPEETARWHRRQDFDPLHLETWMQHPQNGSLPIGVDLINAGFGLLFCSPATFHKLWDAIVHSLKVGGRFCGYLSGDRDYWATDPNFNCLTPDQIEQLFEPFDLEVFDEEEHLGSNALGEERYWHLYNIVARKRG